MNAMGPVQSLRDAQGVTYFARAPLRSYFHDPQKNKIYSLN